MRRISILGGGNIGTQFACVFAAKGYEVTVHSSKPALYDGTLQILNGDGEVECEGKIHKVTASYEEAITDSDIVFITYPSFMFQKLSEEIAPYISDGMCIGVIPGTGGAEFSFRKCIENGAVLFGLQRVPAVARLVEYGHSVQVEGLRDRLHLGVLSSSHGIEQAQLLSAVFGIPCELLPNYLCVTMTPSNPILHTTRLCTLFSDYVPGKVVYERNPLFYGEWCLASSELLLACDSEHQALLRKLDRLDLSSVRSLRIHYESETAEQLTAKMCNIRSLHDLTSPMKLVDGGWIPDLSSRYFTADFPYGLDIIRQIAVMADVEVPNITRTMEWYHSISDDRNVLSLSSFGITNLEQLYQLYQTK